jgi:hypothetical protein
MERRQERPLQRSFCQTGHSGCRRKRQATSRVLLRSPPGCDARQAAGIGGFAVEITPLDA